MDRSEQADEVCANCGKVEVDEVKLKKCACNLEKYCSVDCQKNHRPQHKKACKKRLAVKRDDKLFTQPDVSCFGECPICYLPLPIDESKLLTNSCCCKRICKGCAYANQKAEMQRGRYPKCPCCRELMAGSDQEVEKSLMKRVKANDPAAIFQLGVKCYNEGDNEEAVKYYTKAAQLGDIHAHYNLSCSYRTGEGVEKDEKKEIHHLEVAAIGGHPSGSYNLGCIEEEKGNYDRSAKHFVIAAKLGHDGALEGVKKRFMKGDVSKEDYASSLRGHQAAVAATKSTPREEAYAFFNQRRRV